MPRLARAFTIDVIYDMVQWPILMFRLNLHDLALLAYLDICAPCGHPENSVTGFLTTFASVVFSHQRIAQRDVWTSENQLDPVGSIPDFFKGGLDRLYFPLDLPL